MKIIRYNPFPHHSFWKPGSQKIRFLLYLVTGMATHIPLVHASTGWMDNGHINFQIRPRYETVKQEGKPDAAHAWTMRTILGYSIQPRSNLKAKLEFINVSNLGSQQYNSTQNGKTGYPIIADPGKTAVNQAFINYSGIDATRLKIGRQKIILDNSRFVGNVDFRQNMQTFDAISLNNSSIEGINLFAAHVVHTKSSYANGQIPVGYNLQHVNANLFHAAIPLFQGTNIALYDYSYDDKSMISQAPGNISSNTVGLRFHGSLHLTGMTQIFYTAEYAKQHGLNHAESGIDASYLHVGAGGSFKKLAGHIDLEQLGSNSNGTYGLQTPMGTKHAFNGWADMFLTTPQTGLRDVYVTLGDTVFHKLKLLAVHHDYKSSYGSIHYGTEWDISLLDTLQNGVKLGVMYANYQAKDNAGHNYPGTAVTNTHTEKTWVTMEYDY
ncbi:MAG: alginate export family protein [Pseudomonadota bacterium]|nr:alginate export family protein [Pseudomonadota bacterium]